MRKCECECAMLMGPTLYLGRGGGVLDSDFSACSPISKSNCAAPVHLTHAQLRCTSHHIDLLRLFCEKRSPANTNKRTPWLECTPLWRRSRAKLTRSKPWARPPTTRNDTTFTREALERPRQLSF